MCGIIINIIHSMELYQTFCVLTIGGNLQQSPYYYITECFLNIFLKESIFGFTYLVHNFIKDYYNTNFTFIMCYVCLLIFIANLLLIT